MIACCILLAGLLAGQADAAAGGDAGLEVRRLVRQLDSARLAERDAAEAKLLGLGPQVLDLLPPITEGTPAEVRQRMARVRQKLEHAAADSAAQPSLVTLQADALPLSDVLAALEKQTGNKIIDRRKEFGAPAADRRLTVKFDRAPFWQALDEVADQAGLAVYAYGEEKAVYLVDRAPKQLPRSGRASYAGPFRVEAIRVESRRDLRQGTGAMVVALEVAWEPRLAPISLQVKMAQVRVLDERGRALKLDGPAADLEVPVDPQTMATELRIPMVLPPRDVEKISRFELAIDALLPGKVETFRFDSLADAKPVEKRAAGVTVTLERVHRNRDVWEVFTRIRFDQASGSLASHRTWIFQNPAWLETPKGEKVPYHAFDTTAQGENEVGVAYLFGLPGPLDGYRFVYQTPATILPTSLPFTLQDIPLP